MFYLPWENLRIFLYWSHKSISFSDRIYADRIRIETPFNSLITLLKLCVNSENGLWPLSTSIHIQLLIDAWFTYIKDETFCVLHQTSCVTFMPKTFRSCLHCTAINQKCLSVPESVVDAQKFTPKQTPDANNQAILTPSGNVDSPTRSETVARRSEYSSSKCKLISQVPLAL